jgi:pimeloyl-ACP methyl ester carboxylesterase
MNTIRGAVWGVAVLFGVLAVSAGAGAQTWPPAAVCDPDGLQASGATYRICMPPEGEWNGDLVIWAHGYVDVTKPVGIPEDQMTINDIAIADIVTGLGYGFAATGYSVNGLAVPQGLADVVDLVDIFAQFKGEPNRVYIVGASEGGLITALAIERYPDGFDGGCALCGPIGSFPAQISHYGDFRVLFDVYYPGLMPGDPMEIPQDLIENWESHWENVVKPTIFAPGNLARTAQLAEVAKTPHDPNAYFASLEISIHDALWYNVFATNDAVEKLGGRPYGNMLRYYSGSSNDPALNAAVQRYAADPAALQAMAADYTTTGILTRPLVTLHTLQDQQVPYWHETLYTLKVQASGSSALRVNIPVNRYEHCNFTPAEAVLAFAVMVNKASQQPLAGVAQVLPDPREQAEFRRLADARGVRYRLTAPRTVGGQ